MGLSTDATINKKGYSLRRFRETLSSFSPNVRIGVPFAAVKLMSFVCFKEWNNFLGKTEMSAPVSIKKFNLDKLSKTTKRRETSVPESVAATPVFIRFLIGCFHCICKVAHICWLDCQNLNGTSNSCFWKNSTTEI